ncbi:MAG: RDD family protein [Candidatus Limnocylindrales bacterium]
MPPERVRGPAPGVIYVGFARRMVAYLLDWLIIGVLGSVILFVTILVASASLAGQLDTVGSTPLAALTPTQQAAERTLAGDVLIGVALVWLCSALYFIVSWRSGATIGMRLLGMRVAAEEDGRPIGFGRASARYLGYLVDWIALGLGLLWVAVDDRHQGWHDKIAGTLVVRRV